MAKLRNAKTSTGKIAQYLARKCVIHSPQRELDWEKGSKRIWPRGKEGRRAKPAVYMLNDEEGPSFVAISPGGRAMKVTVEEVNLSELDESSFKKVGT